MNLSRKDIIATGLVAVAGVLYLLWATGSSPPVLDATRATGVVILALGFAASATAVVPGFGQLLHGNKTYMTLTSLIGLVATTGGVMMLVAESEAGLAVVMAAMIVLWMIATIHHGLLARTTPPTAIHTTL
jgi:di/tripeptidase